MTYAEYLRRVRVRAVSHAWPWLCCMAEDTTEACKVDDYSAAVEHRDRLLRTIRAQLLGKAFLPDILRVQRPDWPHAHADGKAIRIAWLDEQIELAEHAEAEAGACTPT